MTPSELKEHTSNYKVLYVEDEPDLRTITTKLLKQFFTHVDAVNNGKEGLDLFAQNEYDLIISDINMPIINGVEMVKSMKEINRNQAVIITSAQSDPADFIALIDAGVDKFVLKPLDLKKLIDAFVSFVIHMQYKGKGNTTQTKELQDKIQSLESMLKLYNSNYMSPAWKEDTQLLDIEISLHQIIFDIQMESTISDEALAQLTNNFLMYEKILSKDSHFTNLAGSIRKLADVLKEKRSIFASEMSKATNLLEEIVLKLQAFREFKGDEAKLHMAVKSIDKTLDLFLS